MNYIQESIYSVLETIAKEKSINIEIERKTGDNSFIIKIGEKLVDIYQDGGIVVIEKEKDEKIYYEWTVDYLLEHGIRSII